ncbi:MAG TPA: DUF2789 domain-containing protein [Spongiibacteraceae bacterium]|nr:DUF2789 domain-containing protein [Spongiibacteraceae bacterium]
MERPDHDFNELFQQLGLPNSETAIEKFCSEHKLRKEEALPDAKFWSPAQAQFLREAWHQDSDWIVTIDQLNTCLRS